MAIPAPLDRIDFALLAALQNDGRLSNKELAARVGLAPSSCLERVRRLRETGALRGVHAELDPAAVGIGLQALIAVRLRQHSRDLVERFRAHVLSLHEVISLFHVAGANDFLVHVAVREAVETGALSAERFAAYQKLAAELAEIEKRQAELKRAGSRKPIRTPTKRR